MLPPYEVQMQSYSFMMLYGDWRLQPGHVESVHVSPDSLKWQPGDERTGWQLSFCAGSQPASY